jgi:hypothetical protein
MALWRLRLLRLKLLALSDDAYRSLSDRNTGMSRKIRAATVLVAGRGTALLLHFALRPFFSHIYV